MEFICRHGGNCFVDKNARCACRACRFEKCKRIGMDIAAVQMSRSKSSEDYHDGTFSDSLAFYLEPSLPFTIPNKIFRSAKVLAHNNMRFQDTSIDSGYIQTLVHKYLDQQSRRHALFCTSLEQLLSDRNGTCLSKLATKEDISEVYRNQMFLMFEWLQTQDEFRLICPNDKALLMERFSLKYIMLDNLFITLELGYSDRFVLANKTFIQTQPESVITMEHSATALMYDENFLRIIDDVLRPMLDMDFTFGELVALRQIMFWGVDVQPSCLTEETKALQKTVIQRTYRELDSWFKANSVVNSKSRIGSLLTLNDRIRKYVRIFSKITSFIPGLTVDHVFFSEFL